MLKNLLLFFLLIVSAALSAASDNLDLGTPGNADQIIDREGYALGYNKEWKQARWVMYRLTSNEVFTQVTGRKDNFQSDSAIKNGPEPEDYRRSGYDRGYLAPAADMKWSAVAMCECFYMSNMSPQDGSCNSGIWNEIENTVRGFACSEDSLFIVTGPIFDGAPAKTIGRNRVAVPSGFFKVVYDEAPPHKMIAFIVRNQKEIGKPKDFACSVAKVEDVTGLKFFPKLGDTTELKASCNPKAWNWSKSQKSSNYKNSIRASEEINKTLVGSKYYNGHREEYYAGKTMPVSRRKAAPVCDKWPETGYWLNTNSMKRHNLNCDNYRKTRGYPCRKDEGSPCGKCGG